MSIKISNNITISSAVKIFTGTPAAQTVFAFEFSSATTMKAEAAIL